MYFFIFFSAPPLIAAAGFFQVLVVKGDIALETQVPENPVMCLGVFHSLAGRQYFAFQFVDHREHFVVLEFFQDLDLLDPERVLSTKEDSGPADSVLLVIYIVVVTVTGENLMSHQIIGLRIPIIVIV